MKVYNKLVRDKIPQIIEESGEKAKIHKLSQQDYLSALELKLLEEIAEFQEDKSLEELADILEVLQAICISRGYTLEQLEEKRKEKAVKRGGFLEKLYLEYVE